MSQEHDQSVQGVINYTASALMTLNCLVSGLASQMAALGGNDAVKAATEKALQIANAIPTTPGVSPDKDAIAQFFAAHLK